LALRGCRGGGHRGPPSRVGGRPRSRACAVSIRVKISTP